MVQFTGQRHGKEYRKTLKGGIVDCVWVGVNTSRNENVTFCSSMYLRFNHELLVAIGMKANKHDLYIYSYR